MQRMIKKSPLTSHFDKINVIPFGVNTDRFKPERRRQKKAKLGLSTTKITLGFRGDKRIKGAQFIIEALKTIDHPDKIELLTISAKLKEYELPRNIPACQLGWTDNRDNIVDFFEACDIFLMPSLAESFGVMAIEAMAAGCTVVCFTDTAVESVTNAPTCGITAEYASSDSLSNVLNHLISSPQEITVRGELGRKLAANEYTFDTYVQRHKALYEKIFREEC